MRVLSLMLSAALGVVASSTMAATPTSKPTVVLVHGAFADSSSWNGVVQILQHDGYSVVAASNPLRSVAGDGAYVHALLTTIKGPIVLVGHSYGGMVISNAANGLSNMKALVFVDAFAPEAGESANGLVSKFPGSLVGAALAPVPLPGGGNDLYVQPEKFHAAFAPDLPEDAVKVAAAEQRPVTDIAFSEAATAPAWKTIPSWFVYGDADTAIPPQALAFMAKRAHSRATEIIKGASHVALIGHPDVVAKVIETAANAK